MKFRYHTDNNQLLKNLMIESVAYVKDTPEIQEIMAKLRADVMVEVKLTVDGVELDVKSWVENWNRHYERAVKLGAAEEVRLRLEDRSTGLDSLYADIERLAKHVKVEVNKIAGVEDDY